MYEYLCACMYVFVHVWVSIYVHIGSYVCECVYVHMMCDVYVCELVCMTYVCVYVYV